MADRTAPQGLKVTAAADVVAAAPFLQRALAHDVAWPGDLADSINGAHVFEIRREDGRIVGAFAARVDRYRTGSTVMVTAAGAEPGANVLPAMVDWVESQAREVIRARQTQCITKRPGLVRFLKSRGYKVAGFYMTKDV